MRTNDAGLGPLSRRVPAALRRTHAYHVPVIDMLRIKLDANELTSAWPRKLRAALARELAQVSLEQYPDPAATQLRGLVARRLGIQPDQLVFGNGSDELIAMLCNAFVGPILFPSPSFVYYRLAATARGLDTVEVPLDNRFELDEVALRRAIKTHRPSVVFLALPNNPTGTLWRPELVLELAALHRDTVIVSDEAYVAYSGVSHLDQLSQHPNLVVMRTLSKIGMAGLRVGFTVTAPAIAAVLEKVRPPYNVSALDQRAATFLLEHAWPWCEERAAEVVRARDDVARQLAARGHEVFASAANFLCVRFADSNRMWKRLAAAGIAVRSFGTTGPLAHCLRITIGTSAQNAALLAAM